MFFWKSRNKVCEKYVSSPFNLSNHQKYITYRYYKRFNLQEKSVTWNLAQDEFHPDSDNGFDGIISIGLYIFHHGEQNSIHTLLEWITFRIEWTSFLHIIAIGESREMRIQMTNIFVCNEMHQYLVFDTCICIWWKNKRRTFFLIIWKF